MDFSWLLEPQYLVYLWEGLYNTIFLTVASGILGFMLAVAFALAQVVGGVWIRVPVYAFSTVIRGTPLLLQLFFLYNGVGLLLASNDMLYNSFLWPVLSSPFLYATLTFVFSVGAYVGEDLRGAMLSVPKGELEAARAFGFTPWEILWRVWLPRTIQICMPTLSNETILLLKSVPLVSTIALVDLLGAANMIRDTTLIVYPPLLVISVGYVVLAAILLMGTRWVERQIPGRREAND